MRKVLILGVAIFVFAILPAIGLFMDSGLDSRHFAALGAYLAGAGTVVLAIAALFTGFQAVKEYRENTLTERAKLLFGLYEKFYEHSDFKTIRRNIDFEDDKEILALIGREMESGKHAARFTPHERIALDQFTDYLNFFEMIAWLWKSEQLRQEDVLAMFNYYLTRLGSTAGGSEIREFIRNKDYENLEELLIRCVDEKKRHGRR